MKPWLAEANKRRVEKAAANAVFIVCATCGAKKRVFPCDIARGKRYCSRTCRPITGANNPKWRGGVIMAAGRKLVYAPDHPNATFTGGTHAYEYRLVAAEKLGRPLLRSEIVHHINGDVTDNRPENLQVMTQSEHAKLHSKSGEFRPKGRKVNP